jgi:hypothetical protein
MKFKQKNVREIAEMIVGDVEYFPYRKSSRITEFFQDCGLALIHDGTTRPYWAAERLVELLEEPTPGPAVLPQRFAHVLRVLMHKSEATEDDPRRLLALAALNRPLAREGFEAFYGDDENLYIKHIGTGTLGAPVNPHRPFTPVETARRVSLERYLEECSEDELIENVLLPLFRQLGFHRVSAAGHEDKALEYGKDVWMRFTLPTQHVLYFGLQAKRGKLDAAGVSKGSNANIAEIHNQVLMMLGHEIFDPETSRRVLVDHAYIVAGGEITKQARNWLGGKLDATKRSQVMFMDRDDILNLYVVTALPLPDGALPDRASVSNDDISF